MKRTAWLMFLALGAGAALAQDVKKPDAKPTAEELARKLDGVLTDLSKQLGSVKSLRSRFEQKKYLEVFEDVCALRLAGGTRGERRTFRPAPPADRAVPIGACLGEHAGREQLRHRGIASRVGVDRAEGLRECGSRDPSSLE